MSEPMVIQGRDLTETDLHLIRRLLRENPGWHRTRLSQELCQRWGWRAANGRIKDMACRTLLLKLERRGLIELPPRVRQAHNERRTQRGAELFERFDPIEAELTEVLPVELLEVHRPSGYQDLFHGLLQRYHYLGYRRDVGENMKYLALDGKQRPLACLLFGAAAWKVKPRDQFIGWEASQRAGNLSLITNNTRFLILPWVKVNHLASYLLGQTLRRLQADWRARYAHELHLVETFVDRSRFKGTSYRAANFRRVGSTQGRSRNDRNNSIQVPIKDIYVYPLSKRFRRALGSEAA